MLCVDDSKRITVPQISHHSWITEGGKVNLVQEPEIKFEEQQELTLASVMKEKFCLENHTPSSILQYVKSTQGRYGKTAGCYNILAQEIRNRLRENVNTNNGEVAVVAKEAIDHKTEKNDKIQKNEDLIDNPSTTQGQKSKKALPRCVPTPSENITKVRF